MIGASGSANRSKSHGHHEFKDLVRELSRDKMTASESKKLELIIESSFLVLAPAGINHESYRRKLMIQNSEVPTPSDILESFDSEASNRVDSEVAHRWMQFGHRLTIAVGIVDTRIVVVQHNGSKTVLLRHLLICSTSKRTPLVRQP